MLLGETALSFVTDGADCYAASLAGTGIGFGPLSVAGEFPAVTDAAIAVDLLQAADVGGNDPAEVTLDEDVILENDGNCCDLGVGKILGFEGRINANTFDDFERLGGADAIEIAQSKFDALVGGNVNSDNTWHCYTSTLSLFVAGIAGTNNPDDAIAFDDLAVFASALDRISDFHVFFS